LEAFGLRWKPRFRPLEAFGCNGGSPDSGGWNLFVVMVEAPGFSRGSKVRGSGPCVKTNANALRFSAGRRRLPQSLSFANDQDPDKNPGRDPGPQNENNSD
jgi:hypothetical protein